MGDRGREIESGPDPFDTDRGGCARAGIAKLQAFGGGLAAGEDAEQVPAMDGERTLNVHVERAEDGSAGAGEGGAVGEGIGARAAGAAKGHHAAAVGEVQGGVGDVGGEGDGIVLVEREICGGGGLGNRSRVPVGGGGERSGEDAATGAHPSLRLADRGHGDRGDGGCG